MSGVQGSNAIPPHVLFNVQGASGTAANVTPEQLKDKFNALIADVKQFDDGDIDENTLDTLTYNICFKGGNLQALQDLADASPDQGAAEQTFKDIGAFCSQWSTPEAKETALNNFIKDIDALTKK